MAPLRTPATFPLVLLAFLAAPGCGASDVPFSGSSSAGSGAAGASANAGSPGAGNGSSTAGNPGTSAGAANGNAGASSAGASSAGASSAGASSAGASSAGASSAGASGAGNPSTEKFSFFVTSMAGLQAASGNPAGFGGDLRFGETGTGAGLRGADKICTALAERSMPSNGKTWRAFLSVIDGGNGSAVNAIDRVGAGPWYDRLGRLVAMTKADLATTRPTGANSIILNDLPNEDGVPNHQPDPTQAAVDNHDTLTGSDATGKLYSTDPKFTCNDWTTNEATTWGSPHVGHSWPRTFGGGMGGPGAGGSPGGMGGPGGIGSGESWLSALDEAGCGAGYHITTNDDGPPSPNGTTVGDGGGYGGFYCLALTP
jgi:hypothetical protein